MQIVFAGPGSAGRHRTEASDISAALSHVLCSQLARSQTLDLMQLCIEEHKQCWRVILDVHVLNDDGGVLDACLFAAVATLSAMQVSSGSPSACKQPCYLCTCFQGNFIRIAWRLSTAGSAPALRTLLPASVLTCAGSFNGAGQ
jgi:3' exoribonuclease family, domain 1